MSKSPTEKIRFHFQAGRFFFPQRTRLKEFLWKRLKKEGKQVEAINYIFCSDEFLLEMNQQYLRHDTLTDIITFELSPKGQPLLSDIYISVERVRENAVLFQSTFKREIHRVIFHGALHLCGYKDKSKKETLLMRKKEEEWLRLYSVPRETMGKKD